MLLIQTTDMLKLGVSLCSVSYFLLCLRSTYLQVQNPPRLQIMFWLKIPGFVEMMKWCDSYKCWNNLEQWSLAWQRSSKWSLYDTYCRNIDMIHMACTHLNTSVVCRNVKWQHFILVTGLFYWSNIHKMKHDNIFIELKTEPNLTPDIMSTTISVKKIKIIIS